MEEWDGWMYRHTEGHRLIYNKEYFFKKTIYVIQMFQICSYNHNHLWLTPIRLTVNGFTA